MWECSHSRPHRDWQQQNAHQFYDIRQRYEIQRIHSELRRLVNTHYFIHYHLSFNNIGGFTIIIKQSLISVIRVDIRVSDQSVVVKMFIICTILHIIISTATKAPPRIRNRHYRIPSVNQLVLSYFSVKMEVSSTPCNNKT